MTHNLFHRKDEDMADKADRTRKRLIFSITADSDPTDEEIHGLLVAAEPVDDESDPDPEEEPLSST